MPFSVFHFFFLCTLIIIIDMKCIPMEMGRRNEMKLNETVNLQTKLLNGLVLKVN